MTILKQIRKSTHVRSFAAFLIVQYIRLVWLTSRWEFIGTENPEPFWNSQTPVIGCFWHGRLLMMVKAWQSSQHVYMLSSNHPDGQIMQKLVQSFGYGTIIGSSSKGGRGAVLSIVRALKQKKSIGITPDGPRGPRHRANLSIIQMARLGQVVIFPVSYSSTRGKFMNSWDRFFLPLPFGRGAIFYGAPIEVMGSSKSDEELRQELEGALNDLTQKADAYCGQGA